jgi:stalled ribosome rescue protein Dom34
MKQKIKKQFGVWMDTHHATVVGRATNDTEDFTVLAVAGNAGAEHNTSEKNQHNDERTLQHKFFKEILSYMQNAEELHLTGTGTSQEQLMRYMADTPQFKNTVTQESTSNKMSDENLVAYIGAKFN